MSKYKFIRFLACFFIMVGSLSLFIHSADANPPQIKPTRNLKLRPMPEGAYQVANIIFLPDADESIWLPNGNYNKNPCTKMGYKLTSCPEHGNCANCPMDPKYMKLTSCNNEYNQFYKVSSDGTSCQRYCYPQYCNTSTYFAVTCPEGTVCDMCKEIKDDCSEILHFKPTTNCQSGYYYSGGRCVRGCSVNSCSGYNLSSAPANATSVSCTIKNQDCSSGATKYKITSCNSGYKLSSDGLSCVQACSVRSCNKSEYYMTTCPIGAVCESCVEARNDCSETTWYKPTSTCQNGYYYNGSYCAKGCGVQTCDGYNLTTRPSNAQYISCIIQNQNCTSGATKYKISSCNSGYKLSSDGNTCIRYCNTQTCNLTEYFMTTCPENMSCPKCVGISSDCSETAHFKLGECINGYISDGNGKCVCQPSCGYERYGDRIDGIYLDNVKYKGVENYTQCKECNSIDYYKINSCKEGYRYHKAPSYLFKFGYCLRIGVQTNCDTFGDLLYVNKNNPTEKICYRGLMPEDKEKNYELIGFVANPKKRMAMTIYSPIYHPDIRMKNNISISADYKNDNIPGSRDVPEIPNEDLDYLKSHGFKAQHKISGKVYTQQMMDFCKKNGFTCDAVENALAYKTIGTKAGDWFIPSLYDFEEVIGTVTVLKSSDYCNSVSNYSCIQVPTISEINNNANQEQPLFYVISLHSGANVNESLSFFPTDVITLLATFF